MSDRVKHYRRELLRAVMIKADLSPEEFSRVVARNKVTVYRWLSGESPVPFVVEKWLLEVAPRIFGRKDEP